MESNIPTMSVFGVLSFIIVVMEMIPMAEAQASNTEMSVPEVFGLTVDSLKLWQFEVIIFIR